MSEPSPARPAPPAEPVVAAMFDGLAGRYDVLNGVLSFGLDRVWRRATARAELARAGEYQHQVVNDDLDTAVRDVIRIIRDQFREGDNA